MMLCEDVLDVVDAIASGDTTAEAPVAAHLASCARCAAALDSARRLERLLQARPIAQPPPQFTARTLARIRRDRWRREQFLDAGFNIALIVLAASIVGGIWLLLHRSGLVAFSNDAVDLMGTGLLALVRRVAPSLPLYAEATALLGIALGIWWWAERDATF